jgi:hypothetical protein
MPDMPKPHTSAWQAKGEDCNVILVEATQEYLKAKSSTWLAWQRRNPVQGFDCNSYKDGISAGVSQVFIDIAHQEDYAPDDDDSNIQAYFLHRTDRWREGMVTIFKSKHEESFMWGVLIGIMQVTHDIKAGILRIVVTVDKSGENDAEENS